MELFQLAEITTKDGLIHQGIFFKPKKSGKRALLWVHGLTGKFYGDVRLMNAFAAACDKEGFGFASFNNRGHDMVTGFHRWDIPHTYRTVGAGYEKFEECIFDIQAGIDFLAAKDFDEIILVGHSTGANKVCFYASTLNNSEVKGIVLSGPLSDRYSSGYTPELYKKYRSFMQKKTDQGKSEELLVGYDFFPLTPNRWMSLYTEGSKEDLFNYHDGDTALKQFSKIRKPLMVVMGGKDEHADKPIEDIQKVFDSHQKSSSYKSVIVPDANHGFEGKEKKVVDHIVSWIKKI